MFPACAGKNIKNLFNGKIYLNNLKIKTMEYARNTNKKWLPTIN